MLSKLALKYYGTGCNCSQCIIKAYCSIYGEPAADRLTDMCAGLYAGLGIGAVCCAYTACIMALGLHCSGEDLKRRKALFCLGFSEKFGTGSCPYLMDKYGCENVIKSAADLLEEILNTP